ncbi:substrate-binding periplasmic protein [Marinimicrobium agarilyticum]|uniref:substrate-binding periplasmic protein n=1 Tax=Marinimicrobium agarilyticum TaxID=306546 RepID=UPI000427B882|nr:transporter substrate-binding domain-containing protein [Marinimicrobium agarilyticum]
MTRPWYLFLLLAGAWLISAETVARACKPEAGEQIATILLPLRQEIRHDHRQYFSGLLQLALDKTEADYHPCEVRISEHPTPQARLYLDLEKGEHIDVIDATAMPERDRRFLAVRFPLLKGLMGYRIAFIREEDKAAFAEIENIAELSAFTAGQGAGWPDVEVLRASGLPVVTADKYEALFRMLRAERFDYFPRGAQEVLSERQTFNTEGLVVESSMAIVYPWPVYFYVNPREAELAERIEQGLHRAKEDGSFDRYFYQHPLIKGVFEQLHLQDRQLIYLCHPYHRDKTALGRSEYWLNPWPDNLCD